VTLSLNHPVPAHAVMIKWKGIENTYIENTRQDNNGNPCTDVYKDRKVFFDSKLVLFEVPNHALLPQGLHCWNFSYTLPPDLPSIFFRKIY